MAHIAIVGASGAVGQELCRLLRERRFPVESCRLLASERSAGQLVEGPCGPATVELLTPDALTEIDYAFFSAGATVSREFAPRVVEAGAVVIDNSSAFRLEPDVPLVVPEVNAADIRAHRGLIANPNCSAIVLAVVLWPLHCVLPMRRVVVSTYQAVSGAGARALAELESQTRAVLAGESARPERFAVPCAFNVFSHDSPIGPDGFNAEERKLIDETRKIMRAPTLAVAPTCMRVPVRRAHTESVTIEFEAALDPADARSILEQAPGVRVVDDPATGRFPTPLDATGQDDVLVGRLRRDPTVSDGRGLLLLLSGDQLRKGAALNAIQIAERLREDA